MILIKDLLRPNQINKWGFINKQGTEDITCKYDEVKPFSEELAAVSINKKLGFINRKGEEVIGLKYKYEKCEEFSERLSGVL